MSESPSGLADALMTIGSVPAADTEADLIDELAVLERIKAAAEARQARAAVALDRVVRARHREVGLSERRVGDGVATQIALARRVSPAKGTRLLGLAKILRTEMPHTLALMEAGELSERRATILARETACLELADRRRIDRELCAPGPEGETPRAAQLGELRLEGAAKKLAYEYDPHAVARRAAHAEGDRHVTVRPAPDTMVWLTALLPVKEGVGAYVMLKSVADASRAAGDPRSRGQAMADALVDGVLGYHAAESSTGVRSERPQAHVNGAASCDGASATEAGDGGSGYGGELPSRQRRDRAAATRTPGIDLRLVMTDEALFDPECTTPAYVVGYGPVPAEWARGQVKEALAEAKVFLKRLYTDPDTRQLTAMDSRSRRPPPGLAEFIVLRDQGICRSPGCNAPIRHLDHIRRWAAGGGTSRQNLQGLCEQCNHAREAPGWRASPARDGSITVTTPTGHIYTSPVPDGWASVYAPSRAETYLREIMLAYTLAA